MNKKVLASILALGIIISVGYFNNSYVLAGDNTPHEQLITRIAQRFNLKEADVEAVFNAVRDEKLDQMQKTRIEKLNLAVNDGVITESQKNALLLKIKDRNGQRLQNRKEMQSWFKSQGINETKLRSYIGFGNRHVR